MLSYACPPKNNLLDSNLSEKKNEIIHCMQKEISSLDDRGNSAP